ncbi:MAG: KH domain-containing protein [Actinobacteria bacterium]|nr:KH domain-containing protein [Actinomycetota bacterium]MDP3011267.1 KH domain-containing protein [Candidatus Hydromicrobium sp.]MBE3114453.1 KH domain-containing protein [Actinomycetota bacterium]MBL7123559.1 KH domain-containing protein [Actinomycetota bacterium]MBU2563799.1 KH domain-containing protein [Actinomycetota bacterium]
MKELLEYMVKELVDSPDDVEITEEEEDERTVIFKLKVAEDDLGKVIGKKGRTANALRILMRAASAKRGKASIVKIMD